MEFYRDEVANARLVWLQLKRPSRCECAFIKVCHIDTPKWKIHSDLIGLCRLSSCWLILLHDNC